MKKLKEIIIEIWDAAYPEDIQLEITLNPSIEFIEQAMIEHGKQMYNKALEDFYYKLIVSSKFSEFDKKLECWSNKQELLKTLKK